MSNMFYGCSSFDKINLSKFYTSSVEDMSNMFYGCDSLKVLDISSFNLSKCNSFNNMFSNIDTLKFINLYNVIDSNNILSNIFSQANEPFVCQKNNIITNPNIYNCCNCNFENVRYYSRYIKIYFNESFTPDNCWYNKIKNQISHIMNGDEYINNIESTLNIEADKNVKIYLEYVRDLSYFLGNFNCNSFKSRIISIDLSNLDT